MNYKLYYWDVPFRGDFIRLILQDAGEKYIEAGTQNYGFKIYASIKTAASIYGSTFFVRYEK